MTNKLDKKMKKLKESMDKDKLDVKNSKVTKTILGTLLVICAIVNVIFTVVVLTALTCPLTSTLIGF